MKAFANSIDFEDWLEGNCYLCKRYNPDKFECEIEFELTYANVTDGEISPELAKRMGAVEGQVNPCREFEPC